MIFNLHFVAYFEILYVFTNSCNDTCRVPSWYHGQCLWPCFDVTFAQFPSYWINATGCNFNCDLRRSRWYYRYVGGSIYGLPNGWSVQSTPRKSFCEKTSVYITAVPVHVDKHFFAPSGESFNSLVAAKRFVQSNTDSSNAGRLYV